MSKETFGPARIHVRKYVDNPNPSILRRRKRRGYPPNYVRPTYWTVFMVFAPWRLEATEMWTQRQKNFTTEAEANAYVAEVKRNGWYEGLEVIPESSGWHEIGICPYGGE